MSKQEKKKKRGRKFQIPDWVIALLIMIVLLKKKKTQTAQFAYLSENRSWIEPLLQGEAIPKRTAYFDCFLNWTTGFGTEDWRTIVPQLKGTLFTYQLLVRYNAKQNIT